MYRNLVIWLLLIIFIYTKQQPKQHEMSIEEMEERVAELESAIGTYGEDMRPADLGDMEREVDDLRREIEGTKAQRWENNPYLLGCEKQ